MSTGLSFGQVSLTGNNRSQNVAVLGGGEEQTIGLALQMQIGRLRGHPNQGDGLIQPAMVESPKEREVEAGIGGQIGLLVPGAIGPVHVIEQPPQLPDLDLSQSPLRGQAGHQSVDDLPDLHGLFGSGSGQVHHPTGATRRALQQALGFQETEGLTQGCPADAQPSREILLAEDRPRGSWP